MAIHACADKAGDAAVKQRLEPRMTTNELERDLDIICGLQAEVAEG